MLIYRITKMQYADRLVASGRAARWNSQGRFVVYTAAIRTLACLENVVHRSGEGLQDTFRMMVIDVPDDLAVPVVMPESLPPDWFFYEAYGYCQQLGDDWLQRSESAILQVPSAIVGQEWNYLLNPAHPDFARIILLRTEPFVFDLRIEQTN